jgi:DNA-binding XRE family transcriptional regulator
MQVVVKTPRIKLDGEISEELVRYLRERYGELEVIDDPEEELIEVAESQWYRSIRAQTTPGTNMRIYRELHGLSQQELGGKLGRFTRQNISNMEHGHRRISLETAKKLAALFDVSIEKFV